MTNLIRLLEQKRRYCIVSHKQTVIKIISPLNLYVDQTQHCESVLKVLGRTFLTAYYSWKGTVA